MAARCAKHGLAMAPDGTCVRCRSEAAAPEHEAKGPPGRSPIVTAAIVIGVLALGSAAIYGWTRHVSASEQASAGAIVPIADAAVPPRAASDAPPLAPLVSVNLPPDPTAASPGQAQADRLASAMHHVPITMYSTANDGSCRRAREWLLANGYPFTDRDVEHDSSAEHARSEITSERTVPVLDIGGQPVAGFDPERVTRALQYAAAQRMQR